MGTLLGVARFRFHEGRVDDFLRLSRQCEAIVAEQDTGTLRYEIYLSQDRTEAVVIEEYRDETALAQHGEHMGEELMAAVLDTAEVDGQLLGDLSPQLLAQLREGPVRPFLPTDRVVRGD